MLQMLQEDLNSGLFIADICTLNSVISPDTKLRDFILFSPL